MKINYNNTTLVETNDAVQVTLNTAGKRMLDNVTVECSANGGGGAIGNTLNVEVLSSAWNLIVSAFPNRLFLDNCIVTETGYAVGYLNVNQNTTASGTVFYGFHKGLYDISFIVNIEWLKGETPYDALDVTINGESASFVNSRYEYTFTSSALIPETFNMIIEQK